MDRAVRLTPALLLVVVVMSPLFVWQGLKVSYVVRYALMAIFYLSNIDSLFAWHDEAGCFSNTWSLACEEHFYIVWSLLLPFICKMKPRWQHATLLFLIATSLNVRIITSMYPGTFFGIHYYRNSFNNFWKMLLGASLRIIPIPPIFYKRQWVYFGVITLFAMLAFIALLPSRMLSLSNVAPGWRDAKQATRTWTDPLTVVCTMLIICGCHNGEGGPSFLETQFLRFQGRVSYAWYLWQLPIIYLLGNGYRTGKAMSYGSTAISLIAATFSTLYVEEPIRAVYVAWKARRAARTTSLELHIQ
jgi:peptidoglycan/LPS O-acetylase OafA/YrhL